MYWSLHKPILFNTLSNGWALQIWLLKSNLQSERLKVFWFQGLRLIRQMQQGITSLVPIRFNWWHISIKILNGLFSWGFMKIMNSAKKFMNTWIKGWNISIPRLNICATIILRKNHPLGFVLEWKRDWWCMSKKLNSIWNEFFPQNNISEKNCVGSNWNQA